MSARTHDNRSVRTLNLIDEYTRESLLIRAERRWSLATVISALADVIVWKGAPDVRSGNKYHLACASSDFVGLLHRFRKHGAKPFTRSCQTRHYCSRRTSQRTCDLPIRELFIFSQHNDLS